MSHAAKAKLSAYTLTQIPCLHSSKCTDIVFFIISHHLQYGNRFEVSSERGWCDIVQIQSYSGFILYLKYCIPGNRSMRDFGELRSHALLSSTLSSESWFHRILQMTCYLKIQLRKRWLTERRTDGQTLPSPNLSVHCIWANFELYLPPNLLLYVPSWPLQGKHYPWASSLTKCIPIHTEIM